MATRKKTEDVTPEDAPATFSDGTYVQEEETGEVAFDSFFEGVDDIEDVDNDPFFMPDGVYLWRITEAAAKVSKSGKLGLNIKLKVEEGPYKGNTQWGPWRHIPKLSDPDMVEAKESGNDDVIAEAMVKFKKKQAQLRSDFEAFGVPADEMKGLNPKDLVNRLVKGRIKNTVDVDDDGIETKGRKIAAYYIADEVSGEDGQGGFGQFAEAMTEDPF